MLYCALGFQINRCFATEDDGLVESSWPAVEHDQLENTGQKVYPLSFDQDACCWLAAASFAGTQAEMLLYGLRFEGIFLLQDVDTKIANSYLMKGFPADNDRQAAAGYAQALANSALKHCWPAVESVAETLIAQGEIDEEGVKAALRLVEGVTEIGRFYAAEALLHGYPELIGERLVA